MMSTLINKFKSKEAILNETLPDNKLRIAFFSNPISLIKIFIFDDLYFYVNYGLSRTYVNQLRKFNEKYLSIHDNEKYFVKLIENIVNKLSTKIDFNFIDFNKECFVELKANGFIDNQINVVTYSKLIWDFLNEEKIIIKIKHEKYRLNTNLKIDKKILSTSLNIDAYLNIYQEDIEPFYHDTCLVSAFKSKIGLIDNYDVDKLSNKNSMFLSEYIDKFVAKNKLIYEDFLLNYISQNKVLPTDVQWDVLTEKSLMYIKKAYKRISSNQTYYDVVRNYLIKNFNEKSDDESEFNFDNQSFWLVRNIDEFIALINNDVHRMILSKYVKKEGTLNDLSIEFNLPYEHVRKIKVVYFREAINNCPNLEEIKYFPLLEQYDLKQNVFSAITNLNLDSYTFIMDNIHKNKQTLNEKEYLYNFECSQEVKQLIAQNNKLVLLDNNEIIKNDFVTIIEYIVKQINQPMTIMEISSLIHDKYANLFDKDITNEQISSCLYRSEKIIHGRSYFRYYDVYQNFNIKATEQIDDIVRNLNNGYYSTKKIFVEESNLMTQLDIRDEYELHSIIKFLLKDQNNSKVTFQKAPLIGIGFKNKESFFDYLVENLAPIGKNEFIEFCVSEYYFDPSSFVSNDFFKYVSKYTKDNAIYPPKEVVISDDCFAKIKSYFDNQHVVKTSEFKNFLNEQNIDTKVINNSVLSKFGFKIYNCWLLKNDVNIPDFSRKLLFQNQHYKNDLGDLVKGSTLEQNFRKELRTYNAIQMSANEFYTYDQFTRITEINKEDINEFIELVKDLITHETPFVSLYNISQNINCKITDGVLSSEAILKLVQHNTSNQKDMTFDVSRFSNQWFIKLKTYQPSFYQYMETLCLEENITSLDKLNDVIYDLFGFRYTEENLQRLTESFKTVYYAKDIHKIYRSIQDYDDEIMSVGR